MRTGMDMFIGKPAHHQHFSQQTPQSGMSLHH